MTTSAAYTTQITRSIQSVLHRTVSRAAADTLGNQITEFVIDNLSEAIAEYGTDDPLTLGELIARDFVRESANR